MILTQAHERFVPAGVCTYVKASVEVFPLNSWNSGFLCVYTLVLLYSGTTLEGWVQNNVALPRRAVLRKILSSRHGEAGAMGQCNVL